MRTFEDLKPVILDVAAKYPAVTKIGVFGSYVHGRQRPDSDVDILVEFENEQHIFDNYFGLWVDLEDALGIKVDLIQYDLLKPLIERRILNEEVRIFDRQNQGVPVPA